ncbi:hypothetical protein CRG98_035474 [Punica granatum]|uniref:Integrase catalytic domain-containing protein n=1 Tax=Punica granatum TaxID=22663 RepID=A0A2I0IK97_PUNGR|nr:hypothetical protein CRG98_035474 [Punica granatum]
MGVDIMGPFPPASGQRKFLILAIDYFTKWVKADAFAKITEKEVTSPITSATTLGQWWRTTSHQRGDLPRLSLFNGKREKKGRSPRWLLVVGHHRLGLVAGDH